MPPLRSLTDEPDWIAIEQFVPASVIKENRKNASELGARGAGEIETTQPCFNIRGLDLVQPVRAPGRSNPATNLAAICLYGCNASQAGAGPKFALLKMFT